MDGAKSIIIGKISSLPSSISKQSTIFAKPEKKERFSTGPAIASPGPTLLRHVVTAVTFVIKSKLSSETSMNDPSKMSTYRIINLIAVQFNQVNRARVHNMADLPPNHFQKDYKTRNLNTARG